MFKKLNKKVKIILPCIAGVIVIVILMIVFFNRDSEYYRSIQVYDVMGNASLDRENTGTMQVFENLFLKSKDKVTVESDSNMRLKLDSDKYVLVEENSLFTIVADGTEEESKTKINLQKGAITSEIQNKLGSNSYYEVSTPNSVMAVRGTVFRVEVLMDEDGNTEVKLTTFNGSVKLKLSNSDGTISNEEIVVDNGEEIIINGNPKKINDIDEPESIEYSDLSLEVLEFVQHIQESGDTIEGISKDELSELINQKKQEDENEDKQEQETTPPTEPVLEPEETTESVIEETVEPEFEETTEPMPEETAAPEPEPAPEETTVTEPEEPTETVATATAETTQQAPTQYTVTFYYNGAIFGQQKVNSGSTVAKPKLTPTLATAGVWEFDFNTPITQDTYVNWKDA